MDANERIYVKHYAAYTTEDVFDQGEVGKTCCAWTSSDNPVDGRFDTIEDALKADCQALSPSCAAQPDVSHSARGRRTEP